MVALPEQMYNVCLGLAGSTFAITIPVFRGTQKECDEYMKRLPGPSNIMSYPIVTEVRSTQMTDDELFSFQQEMTR